MDSPTPSLSNEEKFALCMEQAKIIVTEYRAEAPEGCDPQGAWIAAAIMAVTAIGGAVASSNSAKKQGAAQNDAVKKVQNLYKQQRPGNESLNAMSGLLEDFELPEIDMEALFDQGLGLSGEAMDFMRDQGLTNFRESIGAGNEGLFNEYATNQLEVANWDFSSIPEGILSTLDSSALSRSSGGPIGRAEEISVQNKLSLQQAGRQGAFEAFAYKGGFLPQLINPIDTTMQLANVELQKNSLALGEAQFQMNGLASMYKGEMDQFSLLSGLFGIADSTAGVGSAAVASGLNTASQVAGLYMVANSGQGRGQRNGQQAQTTPTTTPTSSATAY